jgi:hypothetical protein
MLNAIQARLVEETLVEKEVYEGMLTRRRELNLALGMAVPEQRVPSLPDLPDGRGERLPPEVMAAGDPGRDKDRPVAPFIPETLPGEGPVPFSGLDAPLG